jgi:hypothetical protein
MFDLDLGTYVLGRDLDLGTYVLGIPWNICTLGDISMVMSLGHMTLGDISMVMSLGHMTLTLGVCPWHTIAITLEHMSFM